MIFDAHRTLALAGSGALLLLTAGPAPGQGTADPTLGRALYENHCQQCHTTQAHWREGHKASTEPQVRAWVERWQRVLELGWQPAEVDAVTLYLYQEYYREPEPPPEPAPKPRAGAPT